MAKLLSVDEYCERASNLLRSASNPRARALAITFYQQALALEPESLRIRLKLIKAYWTLGHLEKARQECKDALTLAPDSIELLLYQAMIQIPKVYALGEEVDEVRQRYRQQLERLAAVVAQADAAQLSQAAKSVGEMTPIYLHQQGYNVRALHELYGQIVQRLMQAQYPAGGSVPFATRPAPDEPLRIGIACGGFGQSAVWYALIKGWVTCLDPQRFHLYAYSMGPRNDTETEYARAHCFKFVEGPKTLDGWIEAIRQDRLHLIIYPELGVSKLTTKLVGLRLAPVQCTAPGTMVTSGMPDMDYFLCGELFESPEADDHYSERLVRLPNLSYYYVPAEVTPVALTHEHFGLRNSAVLYQCLQALFKYAPQYDSLYPRIARAVGDCQFVFSTRTYPPALVERLKLRLQVAFAAAGLDVDEYVVMIEYLPYEQYHGLNQLMDVFLDTIAHSGGVTTLDALPYGLPMVTWPGSMLCGRTTQGILRRMGITETIAHSADEYIDLAVRLGTDVAWRQQIRARILENKDKVYRDLEPMRALERFLESVVRG